MIMIAVLLIGFGPRNSVKLLNDQVLIDLEKAIEIAPIGHEGNPGTVSGDDVMEGVNLTDEDTIKVVIRDEIVSYQGVKFSTTSGFETRLKKEYKAYQTVLVVDDYAESHVYKAVIKYLDGLSKEMGLKYEEVQY